jgi:hypothetical protein
MLSDALLRRQDLDELAELLRNDRPPLADVAIERQRFVLCRDEDVAESRVDAIAEDEIDDAVRPAEVDRLQPARSPGRRRQSSLSRAKHITGCNHFFALSLYCNNDLESLTWPPGESYDRLDRAPRQKADELKATGF